MNISVHLLVNQTVTLLLYFRYATNNDYLCAEDLQLFLQAEQGVGYLYIILSESESESESEFMLSKDFEVGDCATVGYNVSLH